MALYGRVYDPGSLGALGLVKLGGLGGVFVALLAARSGGYSPGRSYSCPRCGY